MMVNKTELMALRWLKAKGYNKEDIIINSNNSPDFTCKDGKRYEVKLLYGNRIIFYSTQVRNLKDDDVILVFSRDSFISEFLWKDRDNIHLTVQIEDVDDITQIRISQETKERLKKIRSVSRESYEDVLTRLIDNHNSIDGTKNK